MGLDRQKTVIFAAAAAVIIGTCSFGAVMTWQTFQGGSHWNWQSETDRGWIRKRENIWIFAGSCGKKCMEFEYKLESALEEGWVLQISDRSGVYREEWAIRPGIRKIQCRIPAEMFLKICVFNKNPEAAGQEGEFYIRGIHFS